MDTKTFDQLKARLAQETIDGITLKELSEEEFKAITPEQADELVALYGGTTLIKLPERERAFFDWLKENDRPIWDDLWGEDDGGDYFVAMAHLPSFLPTRRGFPICDLVSHDNYHFTGDEITGGDGQLALESALDIVNEHGSLTPYQAFLIEIWRGPIDQWRFAWMYNLPLPEVKKMIHWMITENLLHAPRQRSTEEMPIESAQPAQFVDDNGGGGDENGNDNEDETTT